MILAWQHDWRILKTKDEKWIGDKFSTVHYLTVHLSTFGSNSCNAPMNVLCRLYCWISIDMVSGSCCWFTSQKIYFIKNISTKFWKFHETDVHSDSLLYAVVNSSDWMYSETETEKSKPFYNVYVSKFSYHSPRYAVLSRTDVLASITSTTLCYVTRQFGILTDWYW